MSVTLCYETHVMDRRLKQLAKLMAEDCDQHNPPLSARFVHDYEVSADEYAELCDILAEGARDVLAHPIRIDAASVAA